MDATHANAELFAALSLAQAEVENATKTSNNLHFKSKYADLAEVLTTARPIYAKHGVSLVQSSGKLIEGQVVVTSILAHKSGGYITTDASCVPSKMDAQGIGAATTYLRRFSAAALYCIAQEDDDGEAAVGRGAQPQRAEKPQPRQQPQPAPQAKPDPKPWMPTEATQKAAEAANTPELFNAFWGSLVERYDALKGERKQDAWRWLRGVAAKHGLEWHEGAAMWLPPQSDSPEEELPDFLRA